jgi:nicotinic acid mononucleotide adenylyltransferase
MALDLPNWYQPDAILDEARFVAVHRPGYDLNRIDEVLGDERAGKIQRLAVDTPDVSGTRIRRRVSNSESIEGMTVPAVSAYISAAGLYRDREPAHEA